MARTRNKEYIERINLELYIMDYLERRKNDGVLRFEKDHDEILQIVEGAIYDFADDNDLMDEYEALY